MPHVGKGSVAFFYLEYKMDNQNNEHVLENFIQSVLKSLDLSEDLKALSVARAQNSVSEIMTVLAKYKSELDSHAKNEVKIDISGDLIIQAGRNHPVIRDKLNQINKRIEDIDYYNREIANKFRSIADYRSEIAVLRSEKDVDLRERVSTYLIDNLDKYRPQVCKDDDKVSFYTNDITLRHYDPANGIDYKLGIGNYRIELYFSGEVKVWRADNHWFSCDSFFHTHISKYGIPCWGTEHLAPVDWANGFGVGKVLTAIYNILSTYNPESPYRTLGAFLTKGLDKEYLAKQLRTAVQEYYKTSEVRAYIDALRNGHDMDSLPDFTHYDTVDSDDDESEGRDIYEGQLYDAEVTVEIEGNKINALITDLVQVGDDTEKGWHFELIDNVFYTWEEV